MFKWAIRLAPVLIVAWAGAFGISYAVFEWQDSDGTGNTSAIEQRIDELEGKVSAIEDRMNGVDTRLDELDDRIGKLSTEVSAASGHSHDDCGTEIVGYVADFVAFGDLFASLTPSEKDAWSDELNERRRVMQEACR